MHPTFRQHPAVSDPFADPPAIPAPARQATHPALQAARAAATPKGGSAPQAQTHGGAPAMPGPVSGARGTVSPSAYAHQFQPTANSYDSPRQQQRHVKKPSLFRRSMAALGGSRGNGNGNGNGGYALMEPDAGLQRKPSTLRKSMAWLLGSAPPVRLAPGMGDRPTAPFPNQDPHSQKEEQALWGADGEGKEWDVDGYGASFWNRFSLSQHHAQNQADPMTLQSKEYLRKQSRANRKMRACILFFLAALIAAIVVLAVGLPAIRRTSSTSSQSSDSTSGTPSSSSSNDKRDLFLSAYQGSLPSAVSTDTTLHEGSAFKPTWTSAVTHAGVNHSAERPSPRKRHSQRSLAHHRRVGRDASQVAA